MSLNKSESFQQLPPATWSQQHEQELEQRLSSSASKIIVLDDDPTGTQTVHSVPVYTGWSPAQIESLFAEPSRLCFLLTNSRALTSQGAARLNREIAERICLVSQQTGIPFSVIHRGDSTLRGHFPLEGETVRAVLERRLGTIDGEIIVPCFFEGGRYTLHDTHYVEMDGQLIPAGRTEFAKDSTFGYQNSHLPDWVEEKTAGRTRAEDVSCISLEMLRSADSDAVTGALAQAEGFRRIIVNAVDYRDLQMFTLGLLRAEEQGKRFLFRSAASFVKVRGGISDQPLLGHSQLTCSNGHGGLVIVGSHVDKTSRQLQEAFRLPQVIPILLDVSRLVGGKWEIEQERIVRLVQSTVVTGKTALVYTSREVLTQTDVSSEANLEIAASISQALVSVVQRLQASPGFLITKGGITSSDIATKALGIKRAIAGGQVCPGIPVWFTGTDSKFPLLPLIIFPGNVGDDQTLRQLIAGLSLDTRTDAS